MLLPAHPACIPWTGTDDPGWQILDGTPGIEPRDGYCTSESILRAPLRRDGRPGGQVDLGDADVFEVSLVDVCGSPGPPWAAGMTIGAVIPENRCRWTCFLVPVVPGSAQLSRLGSRRGDELN